MINEPFTTQHTLLTLKLMRVKLLMFYSAFIAKLEAQMPTKLFRMEKYRERTQ